MPKIINNIKSQAKAITYRRSLNNNNMKREFVFPLAIGLVLGALVMVFWQFNVRLNNAGMMMSQLEQAVSQNTKNVGDIITFINNATGAQNAQGGKAPAAPATETPAN
jgi:uncharacterized membrane protein YvbJ